MMHLPTIKKFDGVSYKRFGIIYTDRDKVRKNAGKLKLNGHKVQIYSYSDGIKMYFALYIR